MHRIIQRVCIASCCQSRGHALQYHRDECEDIAWEEVDVVDLGADLANTPRSPVSFLAGLHSATAACLDDVSDAADLKCHHTSLPVWWVRACWGHWVSRQGAAHCHCQCPWMCTRHYSKFKCWHSLYTSCGVRYLLFARTSSRQQSVELKLWHLTASTCHKCSHSKRSCCMSEVQGVCAC